MELPKDIADRIEWQKGHLEQDNLRIKSIHHEPKPCEDCGRIVEDRCVRMSISRSIAHHPHTKHHCQVCKLYKNPETGLFDMTFAALNSHFLKKKKDK